MSRLTCANFTFIYFSIINYLKSMAKIQNSAEHVTICGIASFKYVMLAIFMHTSIGTAENLNHKCQVRCVLDRPWYYIPYFFQRNSFGDGKCVCQRLLWRSGLIPFTVETNIRNVESFFYLNTRSTITKLIEGRSNWVFRWQTTTK